eukprot:1558693-Prymnesium_polylepis.1
MPRKSRSPVGSCRLAPAMSSTTGSLCTLWQRVSACARSASFFRSQISVSYTHLTLPTICSVYIS